MIKNTLRSEGENKIIWVWKFTQPYAKHVPTWLTATLRIETEGSSTELHAVVNKER
jgi:hypothetical protein